MRHVPRRRFSQNFLVDPVAIDDIVASIAPQRQDALVEIGPGLGALTRPLAARVDALHVIEIDRDIVAQLEREFVGKNVIVHAGDVLDFDFAALGTGLRIVGNLPYHISSAILFHLAVHAANIRDMHVMLQREVVARMAATPGDSDYSRLSVMLQYRFAIEQVLQVPADAFRPAPKVESAVARLTPLPPQRLIARDEALFARIVASAFSQRRKTLKNTLKTWLAAEDFSRLAIDPRKRAQELSVEEFVRIADDAAPRQSG